MIGPVSLGSVSGTRVMVGVSWLFLLPMVAMGVFAGIDSGSGSTTARTLVAVSGSLLFLGSVIAHEFGHVAAARRYGIAVPRVVVFGFGGYSEMELEAVCSRQVWRVAGSGPVVSGILGALLGSASWIAPELGGLAGMLWLLAIINVGVAAFNLLPVLPLDGGRMLRASLVGRGRPLVSAERTGTRVGLLVGMAIIAGGVAMSVWGSAASLITVPIGLVMVIFAVSADSPPPMLDAEEI